MAERKAGSKTSKHVDITGWRDTETLLFTEAMAILRVKSKDSIYSLLAQGKLRAYSPHGLPKKKGVRIITSSLIIHIKENTLSPDAFSE